MKKNKNSIFFWLWITVIVLLVIGLVRHFHIKNFQIVKPNVLYTSGQPRGMDYTRLLYKYHIVTFVNVRMPVEHLEQNWHNEELAWMKNNGVQYIELPISKYEPDDCIPDEQTSQKFLEIMSKNTNLPLLLHDNTGRKRVSYLAALWMFKSGEFNLEQITEKIKKIKGEPLSDKDLNFLKSLARNH